MQLSFSWRWTKRRIYSVMWTQRTRCSATQPSRTPRQRVKGFTSLTLPTLALTSCRCASSYVAPHCSHSRSSALTPRRRHFWRAAATPGDQSFYYDNCRSYSATRCRSAGRYTGDVGWRAGACAMTPPWRGRRWSCHSASGGAPPPSLSSTAGCVVRALAAATWPSARSSRWSARWRSGPGYCPTCAGGRPIRSSSRASPWTTVDSGATSRCTESGWRWHWWSRIRLKSKNTTAFTVRLIRIHQCIINKCILDNIPPQPAMMTHVAWTHVCTAEILERINSAGRVHGTRPWTYIHPERIMHRYLTDLAYWEPTLGYVIRAIWRRIGVKVDHVGGLPLTAAKSSLKLTRWPTSHLSDCSDGSEESNPQLLLPCVYYISYIIYTHIAFTSWGKNEVLDFKSFLRLRACINIWSNARKNHLTAGGTRLAPVSWTSLAD